MDLARLDLVELRGKIQQHIVADQAKQKEYYDRARRDAATYKVGDLVLVFITSFPASGKFKGPFQVVRALPNDRYQVEDLREGHRKSLLVVAVEKLKPWVTAQV